MYSQGYPSPYSLGNNSPYYTIQATPAPAPTPPTVSSVVVRHRKGPTSASYIDVVPASNKCGSMVIAIIVTFDQNVTISNGAFTLTSQPSGVSGGGVSYSNPGTLTAFVSGNSVRLVYMGVGDTIPDGIWRLTVDLTKITGTSLPGTGTHVVNQIRRLYGDFDNNSFVDYDDIFAFMPAYNKSSGEAGFEAAFDSTNDGIVGADDYNLINNYLYAQL